MEGEKGMDWKEEKNFQRDQFLAMLPTREDLMVMGFCFLFSAAFILIFSAVSFVIIETLKALS